MENNLSIISVGNEFNVSYDFDNGYHNVYVGLNGQVRRVSFPTAKMAGDFMDSLNYCYKVRDNV